MVNESMYCVRCRARCPNPDSTRIFKNKRGVNMKAGICTNINAKDGNPCGSRINSFMPKEKAEE